MVNRLELTRRIPESVVTSDELLARMSDPLDTVQEALPTTLGQLGGITIRETVST